MKIQSLYCAETNIIIDSVDLKGESLGEEVKWREGRRRERKNRKETKRNRQGDRGVKTIFIACGHILNQVRP